MPTIPFNTGLNSSCHFYSILLVNSPQYKMFRQKALCCCSDGLSVAWSEIQGSRELKGSFMCMNMVLVLLYNLKGFPTARFIAVTAYSSVSVMDADLWFATYRFFSWVLINKNHSCS